jgi:hypothetical protein
VASKRQTEECAVQFTHVTPTDSTVAKISEVLTKLIMFGYIRPKLCKLSQSLSFKESANKLVLTNSRWPQAKHKCEFCTYGRLLQEGENYFATFRMRSGL